MEMTESNSSMTVDAKQMKTWNRFLVDTNAPVLVEAECVSTSLKSRKSHLEKRSSQGPRKAINLKKKKINDLGFESLSVLVPFLAEYTSTQLHDKPGVYISKIKPSRKQYFEQTSDPGPGKAAKSELKSYGLNFPN